ncbi:Conserved mid region of cactin [Seminavis robusta]|uniref:Splicing factor Cactin n=1 Tax=Seminavis robusta TaxID=568900 RepID=A0A9N8H7Z5_9STRA|nr:Conserved mid region of cactin [Seminavis robusta]|eukprot:Sro219_g090590.1 Conserved mid region of cactin (654) ;mRNA; r:79837-81896
MASPDDEDSRDEKKRRRKDDRSKKREEDDDEDRKSSRRKDRKRDDRKEKKRGRKDDSESSSDEEEDRKRHRKSKSSKKKRSRREDKKRHKKKHKRKVSSSSSSEDSDSSSSDDNNNEHRTTKKVVNKKLLEKLAAKGETLEEWRERKSQKRANRIASKFGYTAEENPFNDPNLHEAFTWKKKEEKAALNKDGTSASKPDNVFDEIDKVRKRRADRELQFEEMERIRAEEARMKELENYDEWARKEEEFHLVQQRQRSAIRLVEGREKPIDVLAKNLLLFGLSEEDRNSRGSVKYQERYNALNALESLEAELEEPHNLLKHLKRNELEELLVDIKAFMTLEREASSGQAMLQDDSINLVLKYWEALRIVAEDEIKYLNTGGKDGSHASMVQDVQKIFKGQSPDALVKMKGEVEQKLRSSAVSGDAYGADDSRDRDYWKTVLEQLQVYLAKTELSEQHSKMLVCQLEKLEQKKSELSQQSSEAKKEDATEEQQKNESAGSMMPKNVATDFGNLEEELGLTDEIDMHAQSYSWQDKYRPRKPRYFNRVKTGYDWNKYNQTHYDHDNPPPKIVQGYKFNIFYPDLIDPTKTPQYSLEPADSDEFCILRFSAGPPYEDVAFKIINREWNRSRKRGFKNTFERGVLSVYFNFATHWYRR